MKLQLALLMFCFSGFASAQVLNRVYLNADVGIPKHSDVGLVVHVFKHFSVAGYTGLTRLKVGKAHVYTTIFPFSKTEWLKNRYESKYMLFGVTTQTFKRLNCSFMLGPSWTDAVEFTNIEYHENEYSHSEYATYDEVYRHGLGCAFRVDGILEISKTFGINTGIQYNLNPVRNEWTVQIGLNLGIVRSLSRWDEAPRDKVIIDRRGSYK